MEKVIKKLLYRPFFVAHIWKTGFESDSKRSSAAEAVTKFRRRENRKRTENIKEEVGEIKTVSSGTFKGLFPGVMPAKRSMIRL